MGSAWKIFPQTFWQVCHAKLQSQKTTSGLRFVAAEVRIKEGASCTKKYSKNTHQFESVRHAWGVFCVNCRGSVLCFCCFLEDWFQLHSRKKQGIDKTFLRETGRLSAKTVSRCLVCLSGQQLGLLTSFNEIERMFHGMSKIIPHSCFQRAEKERNIYSSYSFSVMKRERESKRKNLKLKPNLLKRMQTTLQLHAFLND